MERCLAAEIISVDVETLGASGLQFGDDCAHLVSRPLPHWPSK